MFKNFDFFEVILVLFSACLVVCFVLFVISELSFFTTEEDCVSYYLDHNGYILGKCEKYTDKLLELDSFKVD